MCWRRRERRPWAPAWACPWARAPESADPVEALAGAVRLVVARELLWAVEAGRLHPRPPYRLTCRKPR